MYVVRKVVKIIETALFFGPLGNVLEVISLIMILAQYESESKSQLSYLDTFSVYQ